MAELNLGHVKGADGVGIPSGGDAGQVLRKSSAIDYDTGWLALMASHIGTNAPGVSTQDALDGKQAVINASNAVATRTALGMFRLLWGDGTWTTGNITVPGLSNYTFIAIRTGATLVICSVFGGQVRGSSSFVSGSGDIYTVAFSGTYSGDVLTWVGFKAVSHLASGPHSAFADQTVNAIYGIC